MAGRNTWRSWSASPNRCRRTGRRHWRASIPNASPATCWAACAAIAGRSCAARSGAWARRAPACSLYLAQEGRGIGLVNKLRAYALQDAGLDTLDANRALGWGADERDYLPAATMLRLLGIRRVRLLTNNPQKLAALAQGGIAVERVSHLFSANGINDAYLATKADRFGHLRD